jgi:hypothetical protein
MICFNLQLTSDNEIDWAELPIELDVDSETQPRIELDVPDLFTGSYTDDTIYNVTFPLTSKNYRILGSIVSMPLKTASIMTVGLKYNYIRVPIG